jgi:hypothetical protein
LDLLDERVCLLLELPVNAVSPRVTLERNGDWLYSAKPVRKFFEESAWQMHRHAYKRDMTIKGWILWVGLALAANSPALAQGTFENLDFESANLPTIPQGQFGGLVPIGSAVPGWTAYLGTDEVATVLHNNLTLGDASIDILGPVWIAPNAIIEGQYTVVLQSGRGLAQANVDAALSQVGLIPADAASLIFKVAGVNFAASLNGNILPMVLLESGPNYALWGSDISAFAGLPAELRIASLTTPARPSNSLYFDAIQFSMNPIPEPNVAALFLTGSAFWFAWMRRRRWT